MIIIHNSSENNVSCKFPPYLPVPNSNIKLFAGNVVMFGTRPGISWVVHYGHYTYEYAMYNGWHFVSLPDHVIMPVIPEELETVIVIADDWNRWRPRPCPPCPDVAIFTKEYEAQLKGAFITVEHIADRDALDPETIPNGKIVKVNDVSGEVKFYTWDSVNQTWVDFNIATKEDIKNSKPIWEIL